MWLRSLVFFLGCHGYCLFCCHNHHPPFPSPALLPIPPSPPPLLLISTVVTVLVTIPFLLYCRRPPLFLLWYMLSTKLKFSIDLVPITNHDRSSEFASFFWINWVCIIICITLHESHEKISDKVAQNNNHEMWTDDKNILKTFNVGDVKLLHAYSIDSFQILMKLNDNVYAINIFINLASILLSMLNT